MPLYAEAIRRLAEIGFEYQAALFALDFVRLVGPGVPEARKAAEKAREILERVRATVYIERLDAVMAGTHALEAAPGPQAAPGGRGPAGGYAP